jgi:hypothetical protein
MRAPSAGYSGTPLERKLGFKEGQQVCFVNPPAGFCELLLLPPNVRVLESGEDGALDFSLLFVRSYGALEEGFSPLASRLNPAGMLWVAWPKKSSGVVTDLTENDVRDYGLAQGLVDVKVCAIDETWSGLKFVIRLKDRLKHTDSALTYRL